MPSNKGAASTSKTKVQQVREALMFQAVSHAPDEEQESFSLDFANQEGSEEQSLEVRFRLTASKSSPATYLVLSRLESIDEATATAIEGLPADKITELCLGVTPLSSANESQTLALLKVTQIASRASLRFVTF